MVSEGLRLHLAYNRNSSHSYVLGCIYVGIGDAAGAMVIGASAEEKIKDVICGSKSDDEGMLICNNPGLKDPYVNAVSVQDHIHMNGREVFKFATRILPKTINDLLENNMPNIILFPNPADESLQLSIDIADRIEIIDAFGRVVYNVSQLNALNGININTKQLSAGKYLVKIEKDNLLGTFPLMIYHD